jgi:hypothetical protein
MARGALPVLTFRKKQKTGLEKLPRFRKIEKKAAGKRLVAAAHAAVTKALIDRTPPLVEACAIQRLVIASGHRHEFGLLRDRPDASLLLRARWIAGRGGVFALQMTRRNSMAHLTKKQRQERFLEEFLRQIRKAPPGERVYMAVGDLFKAAEVPDLEEERAARRAAEDRGGDDEAKDGL